MGCPISWKGRLASTERIFGKPLNPTAKSGLRAEALPLSFAMIVTGSQSRYIRAEVTPVNRWSGKQPQRLNVFMPADKSTSSMSATGNPSGVDIERVVLEGLRRHLEGSDCDVSLEKIAITKDDAERLEREGKSKPRKPTEKRHTWLQRTIEAEALPVAELRARLVSTVEALLPPGALRAAKVAERSERSIMMKLAETYRGDE